MDNERQQKIKDFLHDPERTIYEQIEEFKKAIEELVTTLQDSNLSEVDTIAGEDGANGQDGFTPARGIDFMTEEDINAFEQFILDKMPEEGIDYPTFKQLQSFIKEQVALIPRIKGDAGKKGNDGKDGSPDSASDILKKIRTLAKNKGLQISDIYGLADKLNSTEYDIEILGKRIDDIQIVFPGGGSGGGGTSSGITGLIIAGDNVSITGSGTIASPYVVNATGGAGVLIPNIHPTGAIDGVNTVYTLPDSFAVNSTMVTLNGARQELGVDYTEISDTQIQFTSAPLTGWRLFIDYQLASVGPTPPAYELLQQDGTAFILQDGTPLLLN